MAIKIDFEKAYDAINWNFIQERLLELKHPEKIIHIIMEEYIEQEVNHGHWIPFMVGREKIEISHLMFADDLLLFANASTHQMEENPNSFWAKVLIQKYCNGDSNINNPTARKVYSNLWKKIVKIWPTFQKHTVKFVGDGTTTRFWTERWVNNKGSLLNIATMNITNIESTVSEWINRDGNWNRNILKNYLPEEKTMKILALPPTPPNKENGTDRIGWMHSDNGDFSVASTYKALANWTKPTTTIWSKIWKWQGPQKAKIFIWKAKHNRIPTNHKKARMFASRGDCHLCQNHQEDLLHALRDCPKVSRTWVQLIRPSALQIFFQANREEWMDMNIQQQLEHDQNQNWMDIFIIACWKM
ncbi:hypothetical protein AHAS_Ahas11G0257700 [Arachis hypogaea]